MNGAPDVVVSFDVWAIRQPVYWCRFMTQATGPAISHCNRSFYVVDFLIHEGTLKMDVICKICDKGALIQKRKYRMSGPVVLIGYILLIPSILGVLISAMTFFQLSSVSSQANASAGAGLAGGFSIFIGLAFFVSGLLGWLLIMKKQILQCNVCGAVVNAA